MKVLRFANLKYYFLMHLIVLAYGFTGILGKLIYLDSSRIVFFRMLIAGLSLLLFLVITRKNFRIRDRKSLLRVMGIGGIVLLHWLTFFKAIQVSTASLAVLCMATTALHVSWLEPLIMKKRFSKTEFVLGILVVFGVIFVSNNIGGEQFIGMLWGLLSAILSAAFAVFNARLNQEGIPSASITIYQMLGGAGGLLILMLFQGKVDASFFQMTLSDFGWLLFLGIVCTSMAFMLMIDVINKIGAYSATLTINLEPVYTILLAILLLPEGDMLNVQFYIGTLFILAVVFSNPLLKKTQEKRRQKRLYRY